MKSIFTGVAAALLLSSVPVAQAGVESACPQCQAVLDDIHTELSGRCDSVPSREELRQQPIYLFLSIFDDVSQNVDKAMRARIYSAALKGMECDNLGAGVNAAQRMSRQVMEESRS